MVNNPHFEEMVWITVINGEVSVGTLGKVKFEQILESSKGMSRRASQAFCKARAKVLRESHLPWGKNKESSVAALQ